MNVEHTVDRRTHDSVTECRAYGVTPGHPGSYEPFVSVLVQDRVGESYDSRAMRLAISVRLRPDQARRLARELLKSARACGEYSRRREIELAPAGLDPLPADRSIIVDNT